MLRFLLPLALLLSLPVRADHVTLLHFTDYHSQALPFYSEDRRDQGGIAAAVAYLQREKRRGALVFSGGDMINKGSPSWSDKFGCAEWPWLNGTVDAMAYGNHDSDYGPDAFARCRSSLTYPILSANVVDSEGQRIFDVAGKPYLVITRNGRRIGVFSTAGEDFEMLVRPELRPVPGARFTSRTEAAREVVRRLREEEEVDAVVMIGHAHREDDEALARAVAGIDLIFGTHSHLKVPLTTIEQTGTRYIAPFQYLTYISRAELHFDRAGRLTDIRGALVPVDQNLRSSRALRRRVAAMQRELERDPQYARMFDVIGRSPRALSLAGQFSAQTPLAKFVLDIVRDAAGADIALSTTSSFRRAVPAGAFRVEDLHATLPYPNRVLVYELTGPELKQLLAISESKKGTDSYAQVSSGPKPQQHVSYRVAVTDYLARVAPGYIDFFRGRTAVETEHEVRAVVRRYIEQQWGGG